jgi:signal transduction histidine kinase/ligand-binding sensor domain-containing protein
MCWLKLSRCLFAGIVATCLVTASHALDPDRTPAQYIRDQWDIANIFPGGTVHAICQTSDGYLWIGTDKGLISFDGFDFRAVPLSPLVLSNTPVLGLTTDADGNLLVQLQGAPVLRRRNEKFETVATDGIPSASQVTAMWRDKKGQVLIWDLSGGTLRLRNEKIEEVAPSNILGSIPVISMAGTPDGKIWLGSLNSGLFYLDQGHPTNVGLVHKKINCLLAISAEEVWAGTDGGVFRWNGSRFDQVALPESLGVVQILTLLQDHDANVWVGTDRGLLRVNARGISLSEERGLRGDGGINALFEDREGSLWVGGDRGLERIRSGAFVTYSPAIGLPSENNGPVYTDADNRTWFAPVEGGLYWLRNGRTEPVTDAGLPRDVVYSIAGRDDEVWVGRQNGGVTRLRYQQGQVTSRTYTERDGLAQNSVDVVYQNREGTVWAGTVNGGVSRFKDGHFVTFTTADGLASNTIYAILETHDGTIWFATPTGLNSFFSGQWRTYSLKDGLPSDGVNCLFEDSSGVLWIGTSSGLASFSAGHIQQFPKAPDALHKQIFGLAADKNGWLWIATSNHVLRARRDNLLGGTLKEGDVREFGLADGLHSTEGANRNSSVVADSLGRIWFSTSRGLSVVDPAHLVDNSPAAIVHLDAISADGVAIDIANSIRIPAGPRRITLNYIGLSLSAPERIRFRYSLDGVDRSWNGPTASREAAYTNLGPGSYRFHIVASNSDGIWNGSESEILFEVEPALWQTWWFRSACFLTAAFLALMAYRYRVGQVTRRLDMQFQERLSERTRIAGELHDTLLQSVQGLILHFQRVRNLLPENPTQALQNLDIALERSEQAIEEGRNAIHDIRSSTLVESDLAQALTDLGKELSQGDVKESDAFRVVVEGATKPIRPTLRDEIYRIVREALRNAFRHAGAPHIEAEIVYGGEFFRIRIRDDGKGIDPKILQDGEPTGHWGLVGMRERAERIGGQLEVWSEHKAGTEIELTVPGSIAYGSSSTGTGFQTHRKAKEEA